MSKKFHYLKTKHISPPKHTVECDCKRHEICTKNSEISPADLIGGLYKVNVVMSSQLAEVRANK